MIKKKNLFLEGVAGMKMVAVLTAVLLFVSMAGCAVAQKSAPKAEVPTPVMEEPSPAKTEEQAKAPPTELKIDPTVKKYNSIFSGDLVQFLIRQKQEEPGFTEEQISYFTMSKMIPPFGYDFEVGSTKEEFDKTAIKYLGKTVTDYDNRAIKTLENGNIAPTGWSPTPYFFVLKSLEELDGGLQKAVCYQAKQFLGVEENLWEQALAGDLQSWDQVFLVEIAFIPENDENGEDYIQYVDVISLGEAEAPYIIYQTEE